MVVLAACGSTAPAPGPGSSPSDSGSPAPLASTYLPSPEPDFTVPATPLGRLERLTGVVGEGVEQGCRLLSLETASGATSGSSRQLLLLSTDKRLTPGARVTVEGHRSENTATTCQQGMPFAVTRVIEVAPPG